MFQIPTPRIGVKIAFLCDEMSLKRGNSQLLDFNVETSFDVKTRQTAPGFRVTQRKHSGTRTVFILLERHSVPAPGDLNVGTPGSRWRAEKL